MCYQCRVDAFAALADPVRRALLQRLATEGPARVVDLAMRHPISRPAISRHLRVLTEAGLVTGEERGRERHYALRSQGLDPVQALLSALIRPPATPPFAADVLEALDLEVRRAVRDHRSPREETG